MEKVAVFRPYMEQQADDHNDLQAFARQSFDHLVADVVTKTRRYSGFTTVKTQQAEVQIAPGRFFDVGGGVYNRASAVTQSMLSYLPAGARRIVTVVAYGVENETDVEERDFLVDVATERTEPESVSTTRSRDAVVSFLPGAESADPQAPAVPANYVAIADILLDPIQVVSVTMRPEQQVTSTEDLDVRTDALELFKRQIEPRVASLASDLASLAAKLNELLNRATGHTSLSQLYQDVADLKDLMGLPDDGVDYGADHFLNLSESDYLNSKNLGYDCKVEEGIRFADANADEFEISLFSASDPNASLSNGFLLPKFTEEVKLQNGAMVSALGIAQYGFQTIESKVGYLSRTRLRYGGGYTHCTNGAWFDTRQGEPAPSNLYDFETWQIVNRDTLSNTPGHVIERVDSYWLDSWKEPFIYAQTVDHTITGAIVGQSFLVGNDFWATSVAFWVDTKAAEEAIHVTLCELISGVPNPERSLCKVTLAAENIKVGWNKVPIPRTFMAKGKRLAMVVVSNANHKLGMTSGQSYLDGTFFYSTDGAFYQGDLTKDLMFQVYGAVFDNPQVSIEFAAINLDGGMRNIDMLYEGYVPGSTQLVFEIQAPGGDWQALTKENVSALNGAPPLVKFRARFVGSRDVMPGLKLAGSRVHVSRPKTAFRHVTTTLTLGTPSDDIYVKYRLERFNDTPHDFTPTLRVGVTNNSTTSMVEKVVDAALKIIEREYHFHLAANTDSFTLIEDGATNSPASIYHVAARTHWAQ